MLLSMTGYGKAECLVRGTHYTIEIKSLNSKAMDIMLRLPNEFRNHELDIRSIITHELERGKVDCIIYCSQNSNSQSNITPINTAALDYYISELRQYAESHNQATDNLLEIAIRLPDVFKTQEQTTLTDDEWNTLQTCLLQAINNIKAFRRQEGLALQRMFTEKLNGISDLLKQVEPLEDDRITNIKNRLEENLNQLQQATKQQIDRNRLEQEMIYYLEKLDITEEKVRLRNHINYFFTTMQEERGVGKKLGFVAQEMGREINTLGSKSNQSEMQIIVVKMKDLLEQIKEQVLNVL